MHARPETSLGTPAQQKLKFKNFSAVGYTASNPMNHLENLIRQYYEWQGYIVRGNIKVSKRSKGGWDGELDIVVSCENAKGKTGVFYYAQPDALKIFDSSAWEFRDIGGITGTKFDRIELIDLDEDGDLDVITCEERENLGVIWYENPTK